nr:reverse transcriptase domain-containing protein [Tanacetum cinerariifolium]
MGQMAEALQERPSCVPPNNTVTKPHAKLKAITTMDGLTLEGSLIPHYNLLVYQEEEQEPETITEVNKFPIKNNSLSGNPTPSYDLVVVSLSPSLTPYEDDKSSGNTISHSDHSLLDYEAFCFDVDHQEEKSSGRNGDPPVPDLRTMEELCHPSLNGRGGPIAPIAIQATNFGLKNDMIQQSIKVNGVTDDALRLYLFPHSLTHHATAWFDRLLRNLINNFKQMAKMFLRKYFPPFMVTKLRNEITNFRQRPDESLFEAWERYKLSIDQCPNHNMLRVTQIDTFYNGLTLRHRDTINAVAGGTFMKKQHQSELSTDNALCLYLFPHSLTHHATARFDHLPRNSINTFEQMAKMFLGTFHFPADFVVIDLDADPRVPLILRRSFLKTRIGLIDVFEGELTLCVGKEAITFNLDQTPRYSANYNDMTASRIDVIDMACEEYSQEVLGFFDVIVSGNPTPYYDPIVSTSSSTLTPFGESDFLLEEFDAFLYLDDDPTLPKVDKSYFDYEELKICKAKTDKSLIDEPHEVELKDLPPHLEYAFLEGDDKVPVIIAKDLSVDEKTALITVLKSHKQAIAWKLFDIKGIALEFCTQKILMEDDFEPMVQHQRRVNPKINDVIKNEVLKLLDAGLIYSISDSPWVIPVHCVPKKGGFTVVENEENELIPTRLVTGWRVCIDYRKLNEATCKDHFPLPFMDQMLERLAGNEYYCFLNGCSGYFQIPIHPKDQ